MDARTAYCGARGTHLRPGAGVDDRPEVRQQLQEDASRHLARRLEEVHRGTAIIAFNIVDRLILLCLVELITCYELERNLILICTEQNGTPSSLSRVRGTGTVSQALELWAYPGTQYRMSEFFGVQPPKLRRRYGI